MVKVNEGGSVLSFVMIGVILVLALVSGTYFVRQKISVSADTSGQTSDTPAAPQPEQKDTPKEPTKKEETAKTPEASQPTQSSNNAQQNTPTTPTAALPQTGPAETLSVVIGAALLTAASTAYIRSRRDYVSL
jgi:LPXTG-motif cell wall-anchored protein